jgi:hypothetical protein
MVLHRKVHSGLTSQKLFPQWALHGNNLFRTAEMMFLLKTRSLANTEIR